MKKATTIDQQIEKYKERNMIIDWKEEKVKEILLDIGYFRLGFYCFPFEKNYPKKKDRTHEYKDNTKFSHIVRLYYLDVNLRHILIKYVNRIELSFRTKIIYEASLFYNSSTWFVDPNVMGKSFIDSFNKEIYINIKKNEVIRHHHQKYINDKYAPSWKTLEFMTFGSMLCLFRNLKNESVKQKISDHFEIKNTNVLENYIESVVKIRNVCAHNSTLFDFTLPKAIKKGPALSVTRENNSKLQSAIAVMLFLLEKISTNRKIDMEKEIYELFNGHKDDEIIYSVISNCIGYTPANI